MPWKGYPDHFHPKTCLWCGHIFTPASGKQIYCLGCRKDALKARKRRFPRSMGGANLFTTIHVREAKTSKLRGLEEKLSEPEK